MNFLVVPTITSFSPTSGPVGTSVVITGQAIHKCDRGDLQPIVRDVHRELADPYHRDGAGHGDDPSGDVTSPGGTETTATDFT